MSNPDKFYPKESTFEKLNCRKAFEGLTEKEKLYAHYLSRASWDGQFITFFQTSPESPLIFVFLDKILRLKPTLADVKAHLKTQHKFSEDDVTALLIYASAFFANGGNYRGFGDSKFLPDVEEEKLISVAKEVFKDEFNFYNDHCIKPLLDYRPQVRNLGFPPNGITTYWSANCNEDDVKIVSKFLNDRRLDAYNQRVFKKIENGKTTYEIRFASRKGNNDADDTFEQKINKTEVFNGVEFTFTRGDYSEIMPNVIENLKKAKEVASNENEEKMIEEYIKYFDSGSLEAHKEGSRYWIKDKGPAVETYIGFIETYRDPAGARAEFEGFVAVVNKEESEKLGHLVSKAEDFIRLMPWPNEFEKDSYLSPDFTALDIITFSGSGVPAGINIPNYDEIRQNEGFKNVHLQNVIMASYSAGNVSFVSPQDAELVKKYREPAFEVQVGLHELLGHGSGKLFQEINGTLNFNKSTTNPLTNKPIATYYREGESYDSVFGSLGSSYEECRAECVGIYLSLETKILEVFNHTTPEEQENILYINWLSMVLSGVRGLEAYNPDTGKWGQAHSWARYAILKVLLETAKNLVTIKEIVNAEDNKPDLLISLDRNAIKNSGKEAIKQFLIKLQVYKSTADIESATRMYTEYTSVPAGSEYARWREIVLARKKPRTILIQSNTRFNAATKKTELLDSYEGNADGFAQSWIDRYNGNSDLYVALKNLYSKDLDYFTS